MTKQVEGRPSAPERQRAQLHLRVTNVLSMFARCFILVLCYPISACGLIPLDTNINKFSSSAAEADRWEFAVNRRVKDVHASEKVASEDVQWWISKQCLYQLLWQGTKNNLFDEMGYNQVRLEDPPKDVGTYPSQPPDCRDDNFVGLAISGGGSRSAVFSAQVLFELERWGLLDHVDVISSVSGGSFTAALFAVSCKRGGCPETFEGTKRPKWEAKEVFRKLQDNHQTEWMLATYLRPDNWFRLLFTHYDRSDVLAETIEDNILDTSIVGGEGFKFRDLNPFRPNLIINATNNSDNPNMGDCEKVDPRYKQSFRFSHEMFECINSDLAVYPIAYAVTASSAFPGVFNYVTLESFDEGKSNTGFLHLYDGGASDNLGLNSLNVAYARALEHGKTPFGARRPKGVLILSIDAHVPGKKAEASDGEPRDALDHLIDTNFVHAFDTIMSQQRDDKLAVTRKAIEADNGQFVHITFDDLDRSITFEHLEAARASLELAGTPTPDAEDGEALSAGERLKRDVQSISTSLNITDDQAETLRVAARILVCRALLRGQAKRLPLTLTEPPYCGKLS